MLPFLTLSNNHSVSLSNHSLEWLERVLVATCVSDGEPVRQWLDKRCDHRLWACRHLLATHEVYAATDAYIMRLDEAARAQGPTRLVRPAAAEDDSSEDEAAQPTRTPATTVSRRSRARRSQRSDGAADMPPQ